MKIIIDAMGGDNAPLEIVKGALLGMEHWGVEVLLTGDTEAILRALRDCGHDTIPHGMEIVHTTETVDMCDDPSKVFRHKKDTSMGVGLTLLRDCKADVSSACYGDFIIFHIFILLTFLFIKQQQAHGRPLIAIYRRLVLSFYFICCSFLWVKTELPKASYI